MSDKISEKKRLLTFKLITISIPFILLVVLEFLLRLFNYGDNPALFIKDVEKPGFVYNNTYVSKRFFVNEDDAPTSYTQFFRAKKPANTYRIFVLGGSSSLGFPYTHRGSFARILQYWLDKTYPEKNFEVINLSITAVNSFTLDAFTNEVIKMNPDAVLIYAGHNEYYGALGAGSSNRFGYNRSIIKLVIYLKKFRVVQLFFNVAEKLMGSHSSVAEKKNPDLMQKMAGEHEIAFGSTIYRRGLNQFRANMDEMLNEYHKHHIPVFLSNIVSNERGQKPFISEQNTKTDTTGFKLEYNKGLEAYNIDKPDSALTYFVRAEKIDSSYAMNQFLIGNILYSKKDYSEAAQYYENAKELDELRFRAPEVFNQIIENLSRKYDNIHFVETEKKFVKNSPHGILGNELFIDHLHPTIEGHTLIAEAFYEAIKKSGLFGKFDPNVSLAQLKEDAPVTAVDSIYGSIVIMFMKEEWPFYEPAVFDKNKPKSYEENLAIMMFLKKLNWEEAMDSLYRHYMGEKNITQAAKVITEVYYDHPNDWKIPFEVGKLYLEMRNYSESLFYFKKAYRDNKQVDIARNIVLSLFQLDRLPEAKPYLKFITQTDKSDQMSSVLVRNIDAISVLKARLRDNPHDVKTLNALGNYYLHLGNVQVARSYIDSSRTVDASDTFSMQMEKKLQDLEKEEMKLVVK